ADLERQFVDCRLQGERPGAFPGRAHEGVRNEVEIDDLLLEEGVVARIEMAGGEREHLGELVVPVRFCDAAVDQRRESARARGPEGDALLGRRASTDGV